MGLLPSSPPAGEALTSTCPFRTGYLNIESKELLQENDWETAMKPIFIQYPFKHWSTLLALTRSITSKDFNTGLIKKYRKRNSLQGTSKVEYLWFAWTEKKSISQQTELFTAALSSFPRLNYQNLLNCQLPGFICCSYRARWPTEVISLSCL